MTHVCHCHYCGIDFDVECPPFDPPRHIQNPLTTRTEPPSPSCCLCEAHRNYEPALKELSDTGAPEGPL